MNHTFAQHLVEIARLLNVGIDPVPLYEVKIAGAEGWSDPQDLGDLLDPEAVYQLRPRTITIGTQEFVIPTYIEREVYWAPNIWAPEAPSQVTYSPNDPRLRYYAEIGLMVATKKQAIDMAKAIGYWMSQGGSK